MGMPPWAMIAGGLLGVDKLVLEPGANIYKTVQGFRNDSNASDALAAIQKYKTSHDLNTYDPTAEGYMDFETGGKVATAKADKLKELQSKEAAPLADFLAKIKSDPNYDYTKDPIAAAVAQGIQVDTSNPIAMAAVNEFQKFVGTMRNNTKIAENYRLGNRPSDQDMAFNIASTGDPGKLKSTMGALEDANAPAAQKEFWARRVESEKIPSTVPEYEQRLAADVSAVPGLKFNPSDYTTLKNSQRELAEKTPNGSLQPYTLSTGGATETGVRQNFMLGGPKEVSSVQYTVPAKVMFPGAYPGRAGTSDNDKRDKAYTARLIKLKDKVDTEYNKNGDSDKYKLMRRNLQDFINRSERGGISFDFMQAGMDTVSNVPTKSSKQSAPQVEATKTIGGKTYIKSGGQWYEQ